MTDEQTYQDQHRRAARMAAEHDRVLAAREAELARAEGLAADAARTDGERAAHASAASLHRRSAQSFERDAARHTAEADVEDHGLV